MGVNAVQTYAKSLLNGLALPFYTQTLTVYINPPNPGKLTGPAAYVWVSQGSNTRQTAPRTNTLTTGGSGFRQVPWTINVWLLSAETSTDPNADSKFACFIDTVTNAWTTAQMPLLYTDAVSGQVTQFVSVGEEFSIEQSPVHSLTDQRLILREALFRTTLKEITQQ